MRFASILVFISFLVLIWFNKLWMQSKFSRTVASLAVLMAMIFGEASKYKINNHFKKMKRLKIIIGYNEFVLINYFDFQ